MIKVELRSGILNLSDLENGQLYAKDNGKVFALIITINPTAYVLHELGNNLAMTPCETLGDVLTRMRSYGLRKAHFKITEIGEND